MRSLSTLMFVFVIGALACFASPAFATVLFQDSFEGQVVGNPLSGCTPPVGASYSGSGYGLIADAVAAPGPGATNSGKFVGGINVGNEDWLNLSAASQAATAGQVVTFNFDAYVTGDQTNAFGLDVATFTSHGYAGGAWNIILARNGSLRYYDGDYQTAVGTFATDTWVPVHVVADYTAKTFQATVGATTFGGNFQPSTGNGQLSTMYISSDQSRADVYYDNVSVTVGAVPEPSSLVLVAVGLVGLLAYAWRKRK
jgi:hypothetical protein